MGQSIRLGAWLLAALLLFVACGDEPLRVTNLVLARDNGRGEPGEPVTYFRTTDGSFYAVIVLNRLESGIQARLRWIAVDAAGAKNLVLDDAEITTPEANSISGKVSLPREWPAGRYRVEVLLRGELAASREFDVREEAAPEPPTDL